MQAMYEIQVQGRLGPDWSAWFAGMSLSPLTNGDTLIRGVLYDQPALYGVLARVRDLGLVLVLVRRVEAVELVEAWRTAPDGDV